MTLKRSSVAFGDEVRLETQSRSDVVLGGAIDSSSSPKCIAARNASPEPTISTIFTAPNCVAMAHPELLASRMVVFVQFAAGVPRTEIWRALQGASSLQADIGKYVIGVSEDIDPDNPDAVFWSLAYRPIQSRTCTSFRIAPKAMGQSRGAA